MDIRLLGDEVKTATKTRYMIVVGGRPGTVTFTQMRILRAFDADGVADLSAILDGVSYRTHIYRLRSEARRQVREDKDATINNPARICQSVF
jgi:hypothetical protein